LPHKTQNPTTPQTHQAHASQRNFQNFGNEPYFQNFGNDQSKEISILTKLMQAMFAFEKMVNNKREEKNKRVVCINCEKEGHTIHTCYKLFPQMRSVEGGEKQDQKENFKRMASRGRRIPRLCTPTLGMRMRKKTVRVNLFASWLK
jgi:hypothetical protein